MPKLKIKNWKGLYTNIDENEQSLETARVSINWRHERGKLIFESRFLSEYDLPIIDPTLASQFNWEWETGIYCTLSNDPLAQNPIAAKYDILCVIAKAELNGVYHRLVYFKDLTNSSIWYEASKNGNLSGTMIENYDALYQFTNSYLDTTIDAEVFFRVEGGKLKIFLPHDVFWLGRLERDMNIPGARTYAINNFYFDKLIEAYDSSDLNNSNPTAQMVVPQRIKWSGGCRPIVTTSDTVNKQQITLGPRTDNKDSGGYTLLLTEDNGTDYSRVYPYTGTFNESGDIIPTTVNYPWAGNLLPNTFWTRLTLDDVNGNTRLVYDSHFHDYYEPYDPITMVSRDLVAEGIAIYDNDMTLSKYDINDNWTGWATLANRTSYVIKKSDFETISWRYKGVGSIDGFSTAIKGYHLIVTATLDEREEVIIYMQNQEFATLQAAPWTLDFQNATLQRWSNYRVTRLKYYVRLENEEIHYLYKDVPFLEGTEEADDQFYINPADNLGISLYDNIGIEVEPKEQYRYRVVHSFRDFVTESGISIGISRDDYTSVYYSVLGGGNLQPDLMYTQNILPVAGARLVNAVAVVNTKLAVITDDTTYIVNVVEDIGALVFTMQTTLEFGVKNQFDVAQIQGGLALNTRHGIYTTTGTQSNLISEPIDDIVKTNFDSSRILYNKDIHELYYKVNGSDNLYRFRFKDQVWEVVNKY